jgi:hypothetical protein
MTKISFLQAIIPALTSALVSFLVAWQTLRSQFRQKQKELDAQAKNLEQQIQLQRHLLERQLERKFTEKLYDLRLERYPEAFEITDDLRGEYLFENNIDPKVLASVRKRLQDWNKTKAAFLLSEKSLKAFYKLRKALLLSLSSGNTFSEENVKRIWECKNSFRTALKEDVDLLYAEEAEEEFR